VVRGRLYMMLRYRAPCPVTNELVNGLISANMRPFVPESFKFPDRIPIAIDITPLTKDHT